MAKGCNLWEAFCKVIALGSYLVSQRITLQAANSSYRPYSTECVNKRSTSLPSTLSWWPSTENAQNNWKILSPLWNFTNSGKSAIDPSCRCQFHHGSRLLLKGKKLLQGSRHIGIYLGLWRKALWQAVFPLYLPLSSENKSSVTFYILLKAAPGKNEQKAWFSNECT